MSSATSGGCRAHAPPTVGRWLRNRHPLDGVAPFTPRASQARRLLWALPVLLHLLALPVSAEPLPRDAVPEPLRPWVDWVLRGHEEESCPFLHASGERQCLWPSLLELALRSDGGRFEQDVFAAIESEVPLPGGAGDPLLWPEQVRVDGVDAPVLAREGRPVVRVAAGRHRLTGRLPWPALPPMLRIPPETGLVSLAVDGAAVPFPDRDVQGRLWLRRREPREREDRAENRLALEVHRRIVDEIPLRLETRVTLRVSGEAREELLGRALPQGFVPLAVESTLPARIENDGRLRVQLRAGRFVLVLTARHAGPAAALTLPAQPPAPDGEAAPPWDESEVWVFEARPALRLVELEGVPSVDPTQTELPDEWKQLPAYRMEPGETLRLVEKRRGSAGAARDRLGLARLWHLDFDGGGATVSDRIEGVLYESARIEMGTETRLGRAAVNGRDQPITTLAGSERAGLEVPLGELRIDADSRVEGGASRLPAVGWSHDFEVVRATLELPPGWRLLHAAGVDVADPTWIGRWTLLDLFVVLVVAMATLRLFGRAAGALALVTLILTYTEPGAPRSVFVVVLVAEGLRRVVPAGRLARAVGLLRGVALAWLVLLAVPFAVLQVRAALFPALERPGRAAPATAPVPDVTEAFLEEDRAQLRALGYAEEAPAAEALAPEAPREPTPGLVRRYVDVDRLSKESGADLRVAYAPDPDATVPTGPGRPEWQWHRVRLAWSGPVESGQQLRLWLVPPWLNAGLGPLRAVLLAAFTWLLLGSARGRMAGLLARGSALGAASWLLVSVGPATVRADIPSSELLTELRTRLLEPPRCHPNCASLTRLGVAVHPGRLDLRLAVDAAAATAIPLPGGKNGGEGFAPGEVVLDGERTVALRRGSDGQLWLQLGPGTHTLLLSGALPPREAVELPLPLRPHRVELLASPRGWTLQGIRADGRAESALRLLRDAPEAEAGSDGPEREVELEPTAIPPFLQVTRSLELGLTWQVRTQVLRVAPLEGVILVEVPLLPGESVTTPGIQVRDGRALIALDPGAGGVVWSSVLAGTDELVLAAPREGPWHEVWEVEAHPVWHVQSTGIPPVDAPSRGRRWHRWQPWPGETLALAIERPRGLAGDTLTIDRSQLTLRPGLRASDVTLALALRSSQGGQHAVTLPEGAELSELRVDGRVQPLRQEGRRVPFPVSPGAQEVTLGWREGRGIGVLTRGPQVELGLDSVNAHVTVEVPRSRWTLFAGGPRLGPVVLFWPVLLVVAALAALLGRVPWTPLRARHWLLLGVGLTQAPFWAAALVVVWLLALGWRARLAPRDAVPAPIFDLMQLLLVGLTAAALACFFLAIQVGLLGSPEMQISGNGSVPGTLRWYQDRSGAVLPRPWVFSLSLWFYRGAMLAWSLWVAHALVGWLAWGWRCFSTGALWQPLRLRQLRGGSAS